MVIFSFILGRKYYKVNYDLPNIFLYFVMAMGIYFLAVYFPLFDGAAKIVLHILYICVFILFAYLLERKKYSREFR